MTTAADQFVEMMISLLGKALAILFLFFFFNAEKERGKDLYKFIYNNVTYTCMSNTN